MSARKGSSAPKGCAAPAASSVTVVQPPGTAAAATATRAAAISAPPAPPRAMASASTRARLTTIPTTAGPAATSARKDSSVPKDCAEPAARRETAVAPTVTAAVATAIKGAAIHASFGAAPALVTRSAAPARAAAAVARSQQPIKAIRGTAEPAITAAALRKVAAADSALTSMPLAIAGHVDRHVARKNAALVKAVSLPRKVTAGAPAPALPTSRFARETESVAPQIEKFAKFRNLNDRPHTSQPWLRTSPGLGDAASRSGSRSSC